MEDQEMERFAMDNDFEGGQFIDGEYYYRNRKEKRRQTKDDSLYGVFVGSSSSSSDDEDRRSGKRGRRGRRDLDDDIPKSAPTFVSGGTVGQLDPPPPDQPVRNADRDAPAQSNRGFSGLGFVNPPGSAGEEAEAEEMEEEFLPTAFGRKLMEGAKARREREKEQNRGNPSGILSRRGGARVPRRLGGSRSTRRVLVRRSWRRWGIKAVAWGRTSRGTNMGMGFKDYKENKSPAFENKEETKKKPLLSAPWVSPKEKLWLNHDLTRERETLAIFHALPARMPTHF